MVDYCSKIFTLPYYHFPIPLILGLVMWLALGSWWTECTSLSPYLDFGPGHVILFSQLDANKYNTSRGLKYGCVEGFSSYASAITMRWTCPRIAYWSKEDERQVEWTWNQPVIWSTAQPGSGNPQMVRENSWLLIIPLSFMVVCYSAT